MGNINYNENNGFKYINTVLYEKNNNLYIYDGFGRYFNPENIYMHFPTNVVANGKIINLQLDCIFPKCDNLIKISFNYKLIIDGENIFITDENNKIIYFIYHKGREIMQLPPPDFFQSEHEVPINRYMIYNVEEYNHQIPSHYLTQTKKNVAKFDESKKDFVRDLTEYLFYCLEQTRIKENKEFYKRKRELEKRKKIIEKKNKSIMDKKMKRIGKILNDKKTERQHKIYS